MPKAINEVNIAMNLIKQDIIRELYISVTEKNHLSTLKTPIKTRIN